MRGLKNRTAIVTGASGGIGFACCKRLLEEGAKVCLIDINPSALETAVQRLFNISGEVFAFQGDVTDFSKMQEAAAAVFERWGSIDILFNIAGITADAFTHKMTPEQWLKVISVNLNGTFFPGKAVIPYMLEQKRGSIVNTASTAAIYGNIGQSNYSASKGGVVALMKTWAKEYGRSNIRSNAVAPGMVNTEMLRSMKISDELLRKKIEQISLRRISEPEEIASVFCFLASDEASFINGQVIEVSGGR